MLTNGCTHNTTNTKHIVLYICITVDNIDMWIQMYAYLVFYTHVSLYMYVYLHRLLIFMLRRVVAQKYRFGCASLHSHPASSHT